MTDEKENKTDENSEELHEQPGMSSGDERIAEESEEVPPDTDVDSDEKDTLTGDSEGNDAPNEELQDPAGETEESAPPAEDDDEDPIIEELIIPGEEDRKEEEKSSPEGDEGEKAAGHVIESEEEDVDDSGESQGQIESPDEGQEEETATNEGEETEEEIFAEQENSEDEVPEPAEGETDAEGPPPKSSFFSKRNILFVSTGFVIIALLIGGFFFLRSSRKEAKKGEIQRAIEEKPLAGTLKASQRKAIVFVEHNESFILFYNEFEKPLLLNVKLTLEIPKGKERSKSYRIFKDYLYDSMINLKFYKEKMSKWDLILVKELHKIFLKWPGKLPVHLKEVTDVEFL